MVFVMAVSLVSNDDFLDVSPWKGVLMLTIAAAVFCDWALASLPVVFMWDLQMNPKLKAGICVLMGMGFL